MVVKVTSKGQVTLPVEVRRRLGITEQTYLDVAVEDDKVVLQKRRKIKPLSDEDPIWKFIGIASGGPGDVALRHDHYLAEGEIKSWRRR